MSEPAVRNDFSVGSIPRTIIRLGLPLIAAQVINALYSLVDRAYIGRIPGSGAIALAGVGLTFPIIMIITALSQLCGNGGAPLCSIARGEGRLEYAERIMGTSFTALVALSLAVTVIGLIFLEPLLWTFGASENTFVFASDYLGIYLCGTPLVMLTLGMNPYINSQGFARTGMLTIMIGAIANIILDPIFIFAMGMGVAGAALATVISQFISAFWVIKFLIGPQPILRLRRQYLGIDFSILARVVGLGVASCTMAMTDSVIQIACNTTLLIYGGDLYISAMTVVSSVRQLFGMALQGIVQGAQPVIGFNYGAGNTERIKASIKFLVVICSLFSLFWWVLIQASPSTLIHLFNDDPQFIEIAVPAVRIFYCMLFMMTPQMISQTSFVALGCSRQAVFFSLLRKAFIMAPLAVILPRVTNLGVMGVFWAEPISDVLGPLACSLVFYYTVWRRLDEMVEKKKALTLKYSNNLAAGTAK